MGTHTRNTRGKVYSSFAYRLGVIVKQYEMFQIETSKKYETTLLVCVLQNLSTQFRVLSKKHNPEIETPLPIWGLELSQISKPPNKSNITLCQVIKYIRDALSHPFDNEHFVYEDIDNENGEIISYTFQKTREFKVTIPIENLRTLVFELSNYLSAELKENKPNDGNY